MNAPPSSLPPAPIPVSATAAADPAFAGLAVGTGGWNYPLWRSRFYAGVGQRDWLACCARRFTGLEVNATFFRFMRPEIVAGWRGAAPAGFHYALKGHRFITHNQRLRAAAPLVERMRDGLAPLADRGRVVLWQLPPGLHRDLPLLDEFGAVLAAVWPQIRHAVEFRHQSWLEDGTAAVLARHRLAVCRAEGAEWPAWPEVTTDLVYLRFYGLVPGGAPRDLAAWAERLRAWRAEGCEVHAYFDDDGGCAPPYQALELLRRLRENELS